MFRVEQDRRRLTINIRYVIKQNNKRVLVRTLLKHCETHARARARTRARRRCYLRVFRSRNQRLAMSFPRRLWYRVADHRRVCTVVHSRCRRLSTTVISPRQRRVFIFTEIRDWFSTSSSLANRTRDFKNLVLRSEVIFQ